MNWEPEAQTSLDAFVGSFEGALIKGSERIARHSRSTVVSKAYVIDAANALHRFSSPYETLEVNLAGVLGGSALTLFLTMWLDGDFPMTGVVIGMLLAAGAALLYGRYSVAR